MSDRQPLDRWPEADIRNLLARGCNPHLQRAAEEEISWRQARGTAAPVRAQFEDPPPALPAFITGR
jgi:hypothetical protein